MGFLKGSCSLRRYRALSTLSGAWRESVEKAISAHALLPLDPERGEDKAGAPIRTLRQLWVPWSVIAPQREADSLAVAAFPLGFATCKPWFELVVVPACDDLWQYRIQYHDASRLHAVPDIVSRDYDSQRAAQVAAEDDWASLCEERGYPRLSEQQIAEREMPCGLPACNRRTISARSKSFVRTLLDGDMREYRRTKRPTN